MTTTTTSLDELVQLLIAEARRRARLRRAWMLFGCVGVGLAAFLILHGGGGRVAAAAESARPLLPARNGPLTIISGGIRAVGGGTLGRVVWPCGPAHKCWEVESLAWSPDGRRLAFGGVSIGGAASLDGLHIVDVATASTSIVRPSQSTERDWLDPAWSSDGRRLAFVSRWTIFLIRPDGSGLRTLETGTEGHDRAPTWSRDGTRIAYQTDVGGEERVYTVRVDGSHRNVIARNASWPAWSPDGATIAYRGCAGIRLATPAGRDVTPGGLGGCSHIGLDAAPAWSPDGRSIAMAVPEKGTFVMRRDGSGLRRVAPSPTKAPAAPGHGWERPSWQPAAAAVRAAAAFPTGTFLTKITVDDLRGAGLDPNDAHWEQVTYRSDGTWRDLWYHPRAPSQPPAHGSYRVSGATLRLLGTPDTVRWHYARNKLTFSIVHVPDRLARFIYTAHPWRKVG